MLNSSSVVNGQLVPQQGGSAWAPIQWAQVAGVSPAPLQSTPLAKSGSSGSLAASVSTAAAAANPLSISHGVVLWAVVLLVGSILALNFIHWRPLKDKG